MNALFNEAAVDAVCARRSRAERSPKCEAYWSLMFNPSRMGVCPCSDGVAPMCELTSLRDGVGAAFAWLGVAPAKSVGMTAAASSAPPNKVDCC